jgi:hypothetical protein
MHMIAVATGLLSAGCWLATTFFKVEYGDYGGLSSRSRRNLKIQATLNAAAAILTAATILLGLIQ